MKRMLVVFYFWAGLVLHAQEFSQRGFMEIGDTIYPEIVPNDRAHAIGEGLVSYEPRWEPRSWFSLSASFQAHIDTHREVARSVHIDWKDRSFQRPALSVRDLSAVLKKDNLIVTLGKQFIRWGEADFLNPTDRFAPKDLLDIIDTAPLAVTAARVTYTLGGNTVNFVWQPWFTPSRVPLLNQRWTFVPTAAFGQLSAEDQEASFPRRSSFGARWNHSGTYYEYSVSYYDGFNSLPTVSEHVDPTATRTAFLYTYSDLRLYGGDFAITLPWFTLKSEEAYYTSPTKSEDEYVIYVAQLERQIHELQLIVGYTGEAVTAHGYAQQFPGERGFVRSVIAHGHYMLDQNRALTLDVLVRQNLGSSVIKPSYSHSFGGHWRATAGIVWLRGNEGDFLGQYHRNSFATAELRYSF